MVVEGGILGGGQKWCLRWWWKGVLGGGGKVC